MRVRRAQARLRRRDARAQGRKPLQALYGRGLSGAPRASAATVRAGRAPTTQTRPRKRPLYSKVATLNTTLNGIQ